MTTFHRTPDIQRLPTLPRRRHLALSITALLLSGALASHGPAPRCLIPASPSAHRLAG